MISLPLHAVAFYCVLFKTPFHAKKYSKKLLYFMIWWVFRWKTKWPYEWYFTKKYWFRAFMTEIYLTKLMIPVILVPISAFTSYGILRSFNFPMSEVTFTAVMLMVMTSNSIVLVFYYRFIVSCQREIGSRFEKSSKILIIIFFSATSVKIRGLLSSSFCT